MSEIELEVRLRVVKFGSVPEGIEELELGAVLAVLVSVLGGLSEPDAVDVTDSVAVVMLELSGIDEISVDPGSDEEPAELPELLVVVEYEGISFEEVAKLSVLVLKYSLILTVKSLLVVL